MSKKEGLIFANARAKSKENNLMSEERLHRIMESKTDADTPATERQRIDRIR